LEIASEVPQVCEELAAAEKVVLDYVRGPRPSAAGLAEARKACGDMMNATSARVRRKK
jgi:hypothetical protein